MTFQLLTTGNQKTLKGEKKGYITYILHLAPADVAGVGNMCPMSTFGCREGCLNLSGHGGMLHKDTGTNAVQEARKRKTRFFAHDRAGFIALLKQDIAKAVKQAERKGMIPVFRLNGTSDLPWSAYKVDGKNIFEHFPDVQFYDYTAVPNRFRKKIKNYHLTFSAKENNDDNVAMAMDAGGNVAVVFDLKKTDTMPATYLGRPVIDGDADDLRFRDPQDVIVGLRLKGGKVLKESARASGFAKKIT